MRSREHRAILARFRRHRVDERGLIAAPCTPLAYAKTPNLPGRIGLRSAPALTNNRCESRQSIQRGVIAPGPSPKLTELPAEIAGRTPGMNGR